MLDSCVHKGGCGIRPVIVGLHEIVENALSQISLAQLVGDESDRSMRCFIRYREFTGRWR